MPSSELRQDITIELADARYTVTVGAGAIQELGEACKSVGAARAFVVVDDKLPDAFVTRAIDSIRGAGLVVARASVCAEESYKTLETVQSLLKQLAATGASRRDVVVAIGGGLTGDVAGFVAATYKRGTPCIQCPTTLLAMVDASVGGKTGVNLEFSGANGSMIGKNLVGAFHQPSRVLADTDALASLPVRDRRAGLGEVIKHAMIARGLGATDDLWAATLNALPSLAADALPDAPILVDTVTRSIRVKALAVAMDEREESSDPRRSRAILNLGHTFAHVIEPLPDLAMMSGSGEVLSRGKLRHGEAVGIGLIAASACSCAAGIANETLVEQVRAAVALAGLPVAVGGLPASDTLLAMMSHDKKNVGASLRLVLPEATSGGEPGLAAVVEQSTDRGVKEAWAAVTSP